jgi:hypothetical protein
MTDDSICHHDGLEFQSVNAVFSVVYLLLKVNWPAARPDGCVDEPDDVGHDAVLLILHICHAHQVCIRQPRSSVRSMTEKISHDTVPGNLTSLCPTHQVCV